MINKNKTLKLPYLVRKPFVFDGIKYDTGDIFPFQPNVARFRNMLKVNVIEQVDSSKCIFKAPHNNFLFKGKNYNRGEEINFNEIKGHENLIAKGIISQELKEEPKKEVKVEPKPKSEKEDIQNNSLKYTDLAKEKNIKFSELIEELRKNEEINNILGTKNPHHMSTISDEILELLTKEID